MASSTTTPEQNIETMRQFIKEVQEKGDVSKIESIFHPDIVDHTPEGPKATGFEGVRTIIKGLHAGLSDIKIDIIHCVSTGDVVATNKVFSGIHSGNFMGKPATGERVQMTVMDFVRFEDGRFREHWANLGPVTVVKN